ncbi:MAG: hypothetical protein IT293_12925 [Deltaproteobacteria bacterium]|nr:hypothetical protein [Deltaproteobacteria bacterium]
MALRLRLARFIAALCLVALLSPATSHAADGDVLAWNRNNAWVVAAPVELFLGPLPLSSWNVDAFAFSYPDPGDPKIVESEIFVTGVPFQPFYTAVGKAAGTQGLKLKFKLDDPTHGPGTLVLIMDPGLHRFTGAVKFKNEGLKGTFVGIYDRTLPGTPDVSDVALRVAFTEKQKAKGLKPGGKATVLVALSNLGPQAFPVGIQDLRLVFEFAPGLFGLPFPVEILKVVPIDGVRDFAIELPPAPMAPLQVPFAIKDVLLLGVQFRVPAEAAGHRLTAIADLPSVDPGDPGPLALTDQDSAPIVGLGVAVKLKNTNDANPIHIVRDDGRPASQQFAEENRIAPGGSRTIKVTDLRAGTVLTFIAGRGGAALASCTGTVVQSGKATVTWDPTMPSFLRLVCA